MRLNFCCRKGYRLKGLLPTEQWRYGLGGLIRGLVAALSPKGTDELIEIPGLGLCIPVRSARAGIVIALRALGLHAGARIGVPLYCCPVVFKAIKAAGYNLRFVDIEVETCCLSLDDVSRKCSDIDAIIPVHMFGNVCDVLKLRAIMGGKAIIEDCAQSIGSRLDEGVTGSFGNIGVFSFRSGKYLSVGEGGALFTKDRDIYSRMLNLIQEIPTPTRMEEFQHVIKTYLRSVLRSTPLYGVIGHRLWKYYNRKIDYEKKTPLVLGRVYRADLAIAINRLMSLEDTIKRQKSYADFFEKCFKIDRSMLCFERPGTFNNRYMYPIIFASPKDRDHVAAFLRRNNIDSTQPYKDIAKIAIEYYGYTGDCPTAEYVAERILVFPSYAALTKHEVVNISNCVNDAWREISYCHNQS